MKPPVTDFDAAFYLASNPDVAAAGIDPLAHYLRHGRAEGRSPHERDQRERLGVDFDALYYLASNSDVAAAGMNPLDHYLRFGRAEGRLPRKPRDPWRHRLDHAGKRLELEPPPPSSRIDVAALAAALADHPGGLVVALSHDDAAVHCGGVQSVVVAEQRAFVAAGRAYLHVSPAAPVVALAAERPDDAALVSLRLGGEHLGVASMRELVEIAGGREAQLVVHHLAGHAPEHVATLARATGPARPVFWVHDFFTLCPSTFLLRNDVAFCGAPPVSSAACGICCYGEERARHLVRVRALFAATRPHVLAPSKSALGRWLAAGFDHGDTAVVPLAHLAGGAVVAPRDATGPLRIAHVGAAVFHKGWHIFEKLAATTSHQFFHLGTGDPDPTSPIAKVPVLVGGDDPDAMARTVWERQIDVVLAWSLCEETFSFTTLEALAGGAFVIARGGSGNIGPAIAENAPGQGLVIDDEPALRRLFEPDALRGALARATRRRFALIRGDATAAWLGGAAR